MPKFRNNDIGQMFFGDTEIDKAYLGNTLVFAKPVVKPNYFWTQAIAAGTFTLNIASSVTPAMWEYVSYSLDDGETWTRTDNVEGSVVTITTPTIAAGDKVLWEGIGTRTASSISAGAYSTFKGSANYNVGGDIGTLYYGDNYNGSFPAFLGNYGFTRFFTDDTHLINAEDLVLSPKKGSYSCYQYAFNGCKNLLTAPTILMEDANSPYAMFGMFNNCSKLVIAPELHVTVISNNGMQVMFSGCSELTTPPPELKITTLKSSCFYSMFRNCAKMTSVPVMHITSASGTMWMREMFYGCKLITEAPELPTLTLASYCYYRMFYNCSALNYIKMMATDISASNCLSQWVTGVASSGTFVKNSAASWTTTGVNGIPSGWTVETASS